MTKEEYIAKMNEDREWAPGWDVIEKEFSRLYPGQEPKHYGTNMASRAIFGGDNYLDGYSVYNNPAGYLHIVTFGMSELYTDPESFGGEYSRYTYKSERYFEPKQFVQGNGTSINAGTESMITALITIEDTTAKPQYILQSISICD